MVLFVGFTRKGILQRPELQQHHHQRHAALYHRAERQRLSDHEGDGPVGQPNGRIRRRYRLYAAAAADYTAKFFENLPQMPLVVVLLIVMLITAFFGLLNGCVVAYLKVPPFLATLGMQTIVYGINLVYSGADPIGSCVRISPGGQQRYVYRR